MSFELNDSEFKLTLNKMHTFKRIEIKDVKSK